MPLIGLTTVIWSVASQFVMLHVTFGFPDRLLSKIDSCVDPWFVGMTTAATLQDLECMAGRLDGKVAIVVGAGCVGPGWGNGRATAVIFAREGAKVFAVDRDAESMRETVDRVREAGGEITAHLCDATNSAAVAAMVGACVAAHGRVDVLVNNVGGSAAGGPEELAEEAWDRQLDYNLTTVFLACKHTLPVMVRQKAGAIVNTSSASGIRFSGSPQVGYAATKAGVIQFSRVVAVQYAKHGIRVNTVIPGQMHTPMVEARLAKQRAGGDVEALLRQRVARIPLGFMGDGRDTAHAALFLASDEARFITGAEIVVDGGMTVRCD
jgi:NAD(P)-dependent dehydrogenase (short-subunit alcohol dehydrogenase family)